MNPLTPDDLRIMGESLARMVETPGWRAFVDLMVHKQRDLGLQGIKDREHSKEYWEGKVDLLDELISEAHGLAASAAKLAEKDTVEAIFGVRLHGGEF